MFETYIKHCMCCKQTMHLHIYANMYVETYASRLQTHTHTHTYFGGKTGQQVFSKSRRREAKEGEQREREREREGDLLVGLMSSC